MYRKVVASSTQPFFGLLFARGQPELCPFRWERSFKTLFRFFHLAIDAVICGKAQKLYQLFYRFSAKNKLLPALPPPVLSPLSYSQTHPIPP